MLLIPLQNRAKRIQYRGLLDLSQPLKMALAFQKWVHSTLFAVISGLALTTLRSKWFKISQYLAFLAWFCPVLDSFSATVSK